ncbi:alanine racemase [candidate division KSB3 bacterium]|uniref:Alanine racemase n=1 Tax=candidate division KSB3 bacterium TaxID=2044937 RepID=A0A9D5K0D9_9BACT|nr:alanine racemase [candidate division KSB3 bacterium]MBD3327335.1 alanine racemase [candidate division KSB3 bacterium]
MNITKPTLLLDKPRAIRNIDNMVSKATRSRVRFRPHFKTHQSAQIGEWFRERGVEAITVSSVDMAEYFARHEWRDITIAFPVNLRELDKINALAQTITLHLLVESLDSLRVLQQSLTHPVHLWIKIDTGYHRTGVLWDDVDEILTLTQAISTSERLTFAGILAHAGHTYAARSPERVQEIYRETVSRMQALRQHLSAQGITPCAISIGDTPTCSIVDDLSDVDEIRPGNFVFYDLTQRHVGACTEDQIAVAVACPVVAKHPERQEIVIYGGAVHLSKESLTLPIRGNDATPVFGYIAFPEQTGWGPSLPQTYVAKLSQEHGIIKTTDPTVFNQVQIGDVLIVLPIHSCLTANLLRKYHTLDGESIALADFT